MTISRERRWDRAKWRATGFILQPGRLPILAIAFENGDAGELIFRKWREDLGYTDDGDLVRVAIITGLSKQRSADYSIIIGPNPDSVVLRADDDPIIPDGEVAHPVEKVLDKLRSSSKKPRS